MTAETITVAAGEVDVYHRLALAVQGIDALTRDRATGGRLAVTRETARAPTGDTVRGFRDHGGSVFVLRHAPSSATALVRMADRSREYVARRLEVPLWPRAVVAQADARLPGVFVPALSRLLRPWLLPGVAYRLPRGTTSLRCRILHRGQPVRWPRVELFTTGGRLGWGHGDERGEVVVVATERAAFPAAGTTTFQVAVRVHLRDPQVVVPLVRPGDQLSDLVVEQVPRSAAPPAPGDLDNDLLRGLAVPTGYTTAPDQVATLTAGVAANIGDLSPLP
jgi:hypothetical protein